MAERLRVRPTGATGRARRLRARPQVWANLGIGLPAVVPLYLAWWLLTEYAPMDCASVAEAAAPGFAGTCNYTVLDHAGVVAFLLLLTGGLVLALVLLVDLLLPRARGREAGPWLAATVLIPVPFAVLWLLAR
ncbi:hypothetical protein AB0K43_01945 [Kitasatospora sp. NPDC049258]|uniref:hypothetical protein n=1 Tax=Kitasatospora sp. NPDC049258 TaxID=3155394 RepID=UPI00342261DE